MGASDPDGRQRTGKILSPECELAGWIKVGERLEPLHTVNGYLARGEVITGRCKTRECFRKVTLDLKDLARIGLGKNDVNTLQAAWRCRGGRGCELMWTTLFPEGVPLQHYVGQGCTIVVRCISCGRTKSYDVAALIATLRRRRAGDGNTSVLKVADAIRGACPSCRKQAWKADLVRPLAPGMGPAAPAAVPKRA